MALARPFLCVKRMVSGSRVAMAPSLESPNTTGLSGCACKVMSSQTSFRAGQIVEAHGANIGANDAAVMVKPFVLGFNDADSCPTELSQIGHARFCRIFFPPTKSPGH